MATGGASGVATGADAALAQANSVLLVGTEMIASLVEHANRVAGTSDSAADARARGGEGSREDEGALERLRGDLARAHADLARARAQVAQAVDARAGAADAANEERNRMHAELTHALAARVEARDEARDEARRNAMHDGDAAAREAEMLERERNVECVEEELERARVGGQGRVADLLRQVQWLQGERDAAVERQREFERGATELQQQLAAEMQSGDEVRCLSVCLTGGLPSSVTSERFERYRTRARYPILRGRKHTFMGPVTPNLLA